MTVRVIEYESARGPVFYVGGITATDRNVANARIVHEWCQDNFGDPGDRWFTRMNAFWFIDDVDATAFKLVWL